MAKAFAYSSGLGLLPTVGPGLGQIGLDCGNLGGRAAGPAFLAIGGKEGMDGNCHRVDAG